MTELYLQNRFNVHYCDGSYSFTTDCDIVYQITIDGRQDARKRLFDKWFDRFNIINIVKIEREVTIDKHNTTATLLYSANNSNIFLIKRYFEQIVNDNFYC